MGGRRRPGAGARRPFGALPPPPAHEELGDVPHPSREPLRIIRKRGGILHPPGTLPLPGERCLDEMMVLPHRGAAPRRIRHDPLHARRTEGGDVPERQGAGPGKLSPVRMQRAAAPLVAHLDDLPSIRRKDPRSRFVHAREEVPLNASRQESDPPAGNTRLRPSR